jgi:hypothetical protein
MHIFSYHIISIDMTFLLIYYARDTNYIVTRLQNTCILMLLTAHTWTMFLNNRNTLTFALTKAMLATCEQP